MVLEKTLESPLDCKESQAVNPKGNQSWIFIGGTDAEAETPSTLATWCKELTHCKRPWCWERLKAGGEGDDRGWDGWMASLIQWTWAWVSSRSWWWTRKPGVLQSMGSQRVRHDWATELNWKYSVQENYFRIEVTTSFWLLVFVLHSFLMIQWTSTFSFLLKWIKEPRKVHVLET